MEELVVWLQVLGEVGGGAVWQQADVACDYEEEEEGPCIWLDSERVAILPERL